ncbi:ubiquinone biosynthesis accessory factor UbiJ [Aliikangiella sp. IMCC44653]
MLSTFNQPSSRLIETVANRILLLDPNAEQLLAPFQDKLIHVCIQDLNLNYYFTFPNKSLVVQTQSTREASVAIKGKLSAFMAAASDENSSDAIFKGELHFSGEINTARQLQDNLKQLNIDWHEPLAELFGDEIGFMVAKGISKASDFFRNLMQQTAKDIPEYLQEELKVTLTHSELEHFYQSVDLTRSQVDRLEARIQRIIRQ